MKKTTTKKAAKLVRLDIGCGPNKREDFTGIDRHKFKGVDIVCNVAKAKLPFKPNSVDEVYASHFIEHLTQDERCHFLNELFRVLKPTGMATLIAPHWASNRAYGDPTHKWPALGEMFFWYLDKKWRDTNAPHTDKKYLKTGYACDFEFTYVYNIHPELGVKAPEAKQYAVNFYKEAVQDIVATLKPRKA